MSVEVTANGMRSLSVRVASEIKVAMVRRGMSGAALAKALGVSAAWISYRLTGAQEIGLDDLQRIAAALRVKVTDLILHAERGDGTYAEEGNPSTYAYPEDVGILLLEPELVGASSAPAAAPRRLGSPLSSTYPAGRRPPGHPTRHGPSGPRHAARTGH